MGHPYRGYLLPQIRALNQNYPVGAHELLEPSAHDPHPVYKKLGHRELGVWGENQSHAMGERKWCCRHGSMPPLTFGVHDLVAGGRHTVRSPSLASIWAMFTLGK